MYCLEHQSALLAKYLKSVVMKKHSILLIWVSELIRIHRMSAKGVGVGVGRGKEKRYQPTPTPSPC